MSFFTSFLNVIQTPIGISIIGLGFVIVVLVIWIVRLEVRLRKILLGKGQNIEQSIDHLSTEQKDLKKFTTEMEHYLQDVERRLQKSIQSVETIRFNAYDGVGANQSFTTVFLNEKGDGVVVSSLYARERTSVFSKPVKNHASEYGLSEEEVQAIAQAKKNIWQQKNLP